MSSSLETGRSAGRNACSRLPFRELAAASSLLLERNSDCFLIAAYFWRKTTHKMNDNFSTEICEFHVQAIGTFFRCHHGNPPANDNMSNYRAAIEGLARTCQRSGPRARYSM